MNIVHSIHVRRLYKITYTYTQITVNLNMLIIVRIVIPYKDYYNCVRRSWYIYVRRSQYTYVRRSQCIHVRRSQCIYVRIDHSAFTFVDQRTLRMYTNVYLCTQIIVRLRRLQYKTTIIVHNVDVMYLHSTFMLMLMFCTVKSLSTLFVLIVHV